jgi:hypothetical protein
MPPGDEVERVRAFTRVIEFDYVGWTIDALGIKMGQAVLGTERYLAETNQREVVREYLDLLGHIQVVESQLYDIYADPSILDPVETSKALHLEQEKYHEKLNQIEPLAESIIQNQMGSIISELGLDLGGQPIPPLLYRTTPPPSALIVSPRDEIRQIANISIDPELSVDEQEIL